MPAIENEPIDIFVDGYLSEELVWADGNKEAFIFTLCESLANVLLWFFSRT